MQLGAFSLSLAVKDIAASAADVRAPAPAEGRSFILVDPDGNPVIVDQHV